MRPFEVDDISSADMAKVQTLTAEYIAESGGGSQSSASETVLAQDLHAVLRPYNEFSRSLMMKRVETTIGCHVCAFFHECTHKCRYEHGGYSWNQEKLVWKPLDVSQCRTCARMTGASSSDSDEDGGSSGPATGTHGSPLGSPGRALSLRTGDAAEESLQLACAASDLPFTQIPVIDFGEFLHGSASQQREVSAQIGDACRNVGFMYLVNHGVPQSLVDDAYAIAQELFDMPLEEKRKFAYLPGGFRGYFAKGSENLDQYGETKQRGDIKEGFDMGLASSRLPLGCQSSPTFHAANRWPSEQLPELEVTMTRYLDALRALAERLAEAFALSLGLNRNYFRQHISAPCINLRLNHYPERPGGEGLGCGAHTDYGLFTILAQDMVGGLQVRNSANEWVEATPLEGSFVINIGDMMQRWTNNVYSSTVHRVVDNANGTTRRFSIPFFFNANCDALVKCLPTCCSEDRPALFEPDTAEKILQDRYAGAFGAKK